MANPNESNAADEMIVSAEGDLNLAQNANDSEILELDNGLEEGDAKKPVKKPVEEEYREEEVDLEDDEDDERTGRVDEELQDAHTQAERDAIKADRKQARIDRRNRARERTDALRREVQSEREQRLALERRIAGLENNQTGVELGRLEAAEEQANSAIEQLQKIIEDATAKGDGRSVALATTRLQEALMYKRDVQGVKERATAQARAPKQAHVDPVMAERSFKWAKANGWYKGPQANDPDSKVLTAIDNSIANEGFDPRTDAYWAELNTRAKKYLPHRFGTNVKNEQNDDNSRQQQSNTEPRKPARQAVAGSGNNGNSSSSGGGGARTMTLSAERVKAMKESGAWEDPERKKDMIRRYREQDARSARG